MDGNDMDKCVKCGLCLTSCPVYYEVCRESVSPRGKVQLVAAGNRRNLSISRNLENIFSQCLMCGTCTQNCPGGVRHDMLFMRMRSQIVHDFGRDWKKRVLYHFLSHEHQLQLAAGFVKFGRNTILEKLARDSKLGNIQVKNMPRMNKVPFRQQVPGAVEPAGKPLGTVLYFTGCATNYVYDDIGRAMVKVLTTMGYQVEIPGEQVCCGLPIFSQGGFETAKSNILTNTALLDRAGDAAVIVDCASCGYALRNGYADILEELNTDSSSARRLSSKVKDISEFIREHFDELEPFLDQEKSKTKVTYHAPCHLRNSQSVGTQLIEQLLEKIPGVEYIRAPDTDSCCGGGGTFFYDHPDISKKIVDKKIKNAAETGAILWVTGCPECRVNLSGNLENPESLQVIHPVQLIEQSLK